MLNLKVYTVLLFTVLMPFSVTAEEKPRDLKHVMQIISFDMQQIVKGIGEADFELIAANAKSVAYHKEPPIKQRQALLLELGFELPKFKGHDNDVHAASMAIKEAAEQKNMASVIENYGKALNECTACHDNYRERIRAVKW